MKTATVMLIGAAGASAPAAPNGPAGRRATHPARPNQPRRPLPNVQYPYNIFQSESQGKSGHFCGKGFRAADRQELGSKWAF